LTLASLSDYVYVVGSPQNGNTELAPPFLASNTNIDPEGGQIYGGVVPSINPASQNPFRAEIVQPVGGIQVESMVTFIVQ
jgi:hypothetical protein